MCVPFQHVAHIYDEDAWGGLHLLPWYKFQLSMGLIAEQPRDLLVNTNGGMASRLHVCTFPACRPHWWWRCLGWASRLAKPLQCGSAGRACHLLQALSRHHSQCELQHRTHPVNKALLSKVCLCHVQQYTVSASQLWRCSQCEPQHCTHPATKKTLSV